MKCNSTRRLSRAELEERAEYEAEQYEAIFAQIEGEMRAEYDANFGPTFQAKWPFKLDGAKVHDMVLARLRADQQ
jgi:hypothetical protein